VAVVPCRSVPALLHAAGPTDMLVLAGRPGWGVRRAAHGTAAEVVTVSESPARRGRRPDARPVLLEEL
jgi:hypothetical protein